jgi:TatA/E family protein of Tat protein translocase
VRYNPPRGRYPYVFAFILDSLGGTELLFILVIALIFFGPRKLPQLARSMGKGLAEFRKASDDFKRTWEREVELESVRAGDNSMLNSDSQFEPAESTASNEAVPETEAPLYKTADSESVVSRESSFSTPESDTSESSTPLEPTRKQDWL